MRNYKRLISALLIGGVIYVGYNATLFIVGMNRAYEFAQSQAILGRSFMDSMPPETYATTLDHALKLMAEPGPSTKNWNEIRDIPEPWLSRGIIFIRYTPDRVSYGWHGGPHAHTELILDRTDNGTIKFIAHYTDYEERKELAEIEIAEQE